MTLNQDNAVGNREDNEPSRRDFLRNTGLALAAATLPGFSACANEAEAEKPHVNQQLEAYWDHMFRFSKPDLLVITYDRANMTEIEMVAAQELSPKIREYGVKTLQYDFEETFEMKEQGGSKRDGDHLVNTVTDEMLEKLGGADNLNGQRVLYVHFGRPKHYIRKNPDYSLNVEQLFPNEFKQ